jgi:hypothetical protein
MRRPRQTFTVTIRSGTSHLPIERIATPRLLSTSNSAIPYVEEALRWLPADASIAREQVPVAISDAPGRVDTPRVS